MQWRLLTSRAASLLVGFAATRTFITSTMAAQSFDLEAFQRQLTTSTLGRNLLYKEQVTSTMTVAKEELDARGPISHGNGFLCEEQTAGIGRRGRDWKSAASGNLYFSFIWAPQFDTKKELIADMFKLNFAISIATVKAAEAVGITTARLKWPNDVWIGDRKLSGMLVNFDGKTGGIAGVGINVNQLFDMENKELPAISLAQEKGEPVSRETVLAAFCNNLEALMKLSMSEILNEYARYDMLKGRVVRVFHKARGIDDDKDYDAMVVGFSPDGGLMVKRSTDGSEFTLSGEEISVRPKSSI
eukprot:m.255407 g.255407  ORF g.255407 m.255407 type:complete len:301 (+) comp19492_c0_seq1:161-1063(+)